MSDWDSTQTQLSYLQNKLEKWERERKIRIKIKKNPNLDVVSVPYKNTHKDETT